MKYLAILFMCNDEKRAEFVIENFKKHNPEIHLIVYNGGNSVQHFKNKYDIELIEGPNLWHKRTHCRVGSFNYAWFETLFFLYKKHKPEYLIFLETDVLTTKKIELEPKYDISGVCVGCGVLERILLYYYWGDYLKGKGFFSMNNCENWEHKYHTGMGATALSKRFFEQTEKNLHLVKECYELIPFSCFADLMITLLARYSGCTMGDWEEASDTRGTVRRRNNGWIYESRNDNCALIHNYKI
jgi:hypothetical protein